ncbi:MAG: hypothetical protein ABI211_04330 [Vicinamibacterales bacterium]
MSFDSSDSNYTSRSFFSNAATALLMTSAPAFSARAPDTTDGLRVSFAPRSVVDVHEVDHHLAGLRPPAVV